MVGLTDNLLRREASQRVYDAAARLMPQALEGQSFEIFYAGSFFNLDSAANYRLSVVPEGPDAGKVALYKKGESRNWNLVPEVAPADYRGLIRSGEDLAAAVTRILQERAQQSNTAQY